MNELLALGLAVTFGALYNAAFDRWGREQNVTALWVVFGVLATLILASMVATSSIRLRIMYHGEPIPLTNAQHAAFHCLKFFVATGAPMVLGAVRRALCPT